MPSGVQFAHTVKPAVFVDKFTVNERGTKAPNRILYQAHVFASEDYFVFVVAKNPKKPGLQHFPSPSTLVTEPLECSIQCTRKDLLVY